MHPLWWFTPFGPAFFFMGLLSPSQERQDTSDMQQRLVHHLQLLATDMAERFSATINGSFTT